MNALIGDRGSCVKRSRWIAAPFPIAVTAITLVRVGVYLRTGEATFLPFLLASICLSVGAIVIRFLVLDTDAAARRLEATALEYGSNAGSSPCACRPHRFLNLMPVAMCVCTLADYMLHVAFLAGMLTFLVAQIIYIVAFVGIIRMRSALAAQNRTIRATAWAALIVWPAIAATIYFGAILNPAEVMTIMVIPYVVALTAMVVLASAQLGSPRAPGFKILLVTGAVFFLVSDSILAYNRFTAPVPGGGLVVGTTYLVAVFCLQYAVLWLRCRS